MRRIHSTAPLAAALVLLAPGLAEAKDEPQHAAVIQQLLACRAMSDGAARLACYDAAAGRMGEAEAKGDIVVIDRAQAQQAHREAFGLHVPSLGFVTRALAPEDVDQIQGVVKSARADAYGKWTFQLQDGAVWRQIDGELFRDPKPGQNVVIRRAALGSFKMSVDGQPTIKVHRDN